MSLDATLTLDGLLAAWGQAKSPYDLTGNGTVDADDLLQFINGLPGSNPGSPPENVKPQVAVAESEPDEVATPIPIEHEAVATAVDSRDVALVAVQPDVVAVPTPVVPSAPEPLTLDGLMAAWGQASSAYDLSGNGIVDTDDLLQFINGLTNDQVATPQAIPQLATMGPPDVADKTVGAKMKLGGIASLADTLIDRLTRAGFEHQPPTNIRELVDKLGLNANENDHVFQRLSQQYPRGLGVNALG